MTAAQSVAQRQKAEAESFLMKVWKDYPHLVQLGGQAILDGTVAGMERLSPRWSAENLTEATFLAGLRHAFDLGILPKPPVQVVEVPAAPTAQQLEDERIARQVKEDERRTALYNKQKYSSSKHNHALDVANEPKENISAREEKQAEARCGLIQGRSHSETEQIKKYFVMKDNDRSQIDWRATEQARLKMARIRDRVRQTNPRY